MDEPMKQTTPPKVFITSRESVCDECGEELGRKAWIMLAGDRGALCLACADLDHLVFLPAGDTAVTRRARKHSTLAAVVLKWSQARKRYERQGLLVEAQALEQAEKECLADAEVRTRWRQREAERRADLDQQYVARFAARVRELYPHCPAGREMVILAIHKPIRRGVGVCVRLWHRRGHSAWIGCRLAGVSCCGWIGAGADPERGRDSLAAKDVGGSDRRIVIQVSRGPILGKGSSYGT